MHRDRALAALLAVAVLFPSVTTAADPKVSARGELRRRTLIIDDLNLGSLPEIHVAGGAATILAFEVPVKDGGAFIGDVRSLFYPPQQSGKTLILIPKADLIQPVPLNITLADGTLLSFKLTTVPKESDVQVDVVVALQNRAAPDSAQALRATIEQLRSELDGCVAASAGAGATKVAALFLEQSLDEPQTFDRHPLRGGDKQNRLLVEPRWIYRLVGLTYMVFTVENRDPSKAWVLDRAEVKVTGAGDALDLSVLAASTEVPILAPGTGEKVVVAFKTPAQAATHRYTVTLVEKDGGRRVVLEGLSP
jgi:uncharacterized protein (TIGR02268 family)